MATRGGQAPDWASWSLFHGAGAPLAGAGSGNTSRDEHNQRGNELNGSSAAALTTLLRHDADGLTWWDFKEEATQDQGLAGGPGLPIDADEIDRILSVNETKASVKKEHRDEDSANDERIANVKSPDGETRAGPSDNQRWRFDPLSDTESMALERALRMSKYVPMDPELGVNEDETVIFEYREGERSKRPKREKRIDKDTGKRAYRSMRGTTVSANKAARDVLQQLCSTMLPQRNFDWIIAQLAYPATDMLRIPRELLVKAEHRAAIAEAQSYATGTTMPLENTAIILHSLARASGVEFTPEITIVDPNAAAARHRGRPTKDARHRMATQSNAVLSVLRELFPQHFPGGKEEDAQSARPAVQAAAARLREMQRSEEPSARSQSNSSHDRTSRSASKESTDDEQSVDLGIGPSSSRSTNHVENLNQTVPSKESADLHEPQDGKVLQPSTSNGSGGLMGWLRGAKGKDIIQEARTRGAHASTSETVDVTKQRGKRRKDDVALKDRGSKRTKLRRAAQPVDDVLDGQEDSVMVQEQGEGSDNMHDDDVAASAETSQTTRRSRRGDGSTADWKMPLPSFWARPGPSQTKH